MQDAYWWNMCALPAAGCGRKFGLLRPSVKYCVWLGPPDCYRNQEQVLLTLSDAARAMDTASRLVHHRRSGHRIRESSFARAVLERDGATPFNLIPLSNTHGKSIHPARTPYEVADWWVRYLCPPGGTVLDPFMGVGTIGIAALDRGMGYVGIERVPEYFEVARKVLHRDDKRGEVDFS